MGIAGRDAMPMRSARNAAIGVLLALLLGCGKSAPLTGSAGAGGGAGMDAAASAGTGGPGEPDAATEAAPGDARPPGGETAVSAGPGGDGGYRCDPPYSCPDGSADDICNWGTGLCGAIYNDYSRAIVEATHCTLDAPDQCLYSVQGSLQYPCPNCNSWVNHRDQLDNLKAQWIAAGCMKCINPQVCTNLRCTQPTKGVCTMKTSVPPAGGGPQVSIECTNQP
jgi:hypothetical protein